jgi:hypothetical protein
MKELQEDGGGVGRAHLPFRLIPQRGPAALPRDAVIRKRPVIGQRALRLPALKAGVVPGMAFQRFPLEEDEQSGCSISHVPSSRSRAGASKTRNTDL